MVFNRRIFFVVLLISIISLSSILFLNLGNDRKFTPLKTDIYCDSSPSISVGVPSELMFGDDLNISLSITASSYMVINRLVFSVAGNGEIYNESIDVDIVLAKDSTYQDNYLLGASIGNNGSLLVLRPGTFSLEKTYLSFFSCLLQKEQSFPVSSQFQIQNYQKEERGLSIQWESNIPFSQNSTTLYFGSSSQDRFLNLSGLIDLTGIYNSSLLLSGVQDLRLYFNKSLVLTNPDPTSFIPTSSYVGIFDIAITATLPANVSSSISISFPTRRVILLAAILDDGWSSTFPSPLYYFNEVNRRFEKVFNLTIVPAIIIPIHYTGSSNVLELVDYGRYEFGRIFNTQAWKFSSVLYPVNLGLNMLLIVTNKTMSNYGVVIGDANGPFNIALNAGGSELTGGLRLSAAWGDNLFQHEISHVLGALDRYSSQDLPSVMTKPENSNEALRDISQGTLWLTLTNWLNKDLILMSKIISRL